MGQLIRTLDRHVVGPVAVFTTDRTITGQDGAGFVPGDTGDGYPAHLAARLSAAVDGLDRVFVASNQVVVHRSSGWDEAALVEAEAAIAGFFVFYGEAG